MMESAQSERERERDACILPRCEVHRHIQNRKMLSLAHLFEAMSRSLLVMLLKCVNKTRATEREGERGR